MHHLLSAFSATVLKRLCKERNIRTNAATKRELIRRLQKYATQAIVYDGRPKRGLLKEAKARKIDCSQTKSSAAIIALLESADRSRTFHPFLDIPAELRNGSTAMPSSSMTPCGYRGVVRGSPRFVGRRRS
ncbi:hypothetical protein LTR91_020715 [Friedmanniomyces endolithicus]|uniref:SAP domain-containing protein n=1 Tax=Friedmanniomyces endolithicus TaxID=329885 RepID=A0AAN6H8V4_9PEZI|nr:hypothetical protein LTR94_009290 [Friedmanniomyces endolithicus]KAK0797067.1 hypothetical protein LTR59_006912 [Friedmanniomyces endolithicus]KAK0798007.1 hypothetical protein LTR38_008001 [Friedmanniomyces endolithicus]KAK0813676.1 hypothetical protein LTR75_004489 [Friedmanniomyces endolithicus]KAK0881006.1 hypothetical protein LTR87_005127 [Friedmanniomyces endolithicus]